MARVVYKRDEGLGFYIPLKCDEIWLVYKMDEAWGLIYLKNCIVARLVYKKNAP